ncbi:MAG: response regulator transcription factor, partial [Caldimonas sp.]
FDVLLVDAGLAGASASDTSRSLRARSEVPLILLLDDGAFAARVAALDSGADDCLVKPFDRRELVARIGAVVRRSGGRRGNIRDAQGGAHVRFNGWLLDAGRRLLVAPDGVPVALSAHEVQLMTTFVAKAGEVISRRRLLALVEATGSASTERGIEASVARLRRKLGADATLIRTVRGEGFVFRGRVEAFES